MRAGTKFVFTIMLLMALCAWMTPPAGDIQKAEWLIGTWENKMPKGSQYETWSKTSDSELSGKSFMVKGKDTVVFETIRLVQEQDGLFYIPVVKKQNKGKPVRFAAKTISETELVFENPKHDFPQVISYKKISADSLVAEISGSKKRTQTFPMSRVK